MDEKKVLQPIEELLERLTVAATFGAPVTEGEVTLIPVASVAYGFGYGAGPGEPHAEPAADVEAETPEKGASGGGGGGQAKPLGFIRIDAQGVKYEPLFNPQAASLAGIALMAWSVFWITKTVRAFVQKPCCG